jgi:putative iron-only hydrogenase system regulator
MEKRLGVVAILVTDTTSVQKINTLLSEFAELILGRQGIPLREKGIHVISLVVEGNTDRIGALTGKIGQLRGVEVKSILTTFKEGERHDREAAQKI